MAHLEELTADYAMWEVDGNWVMHQVKVKLPTRTGERVWKRQYLTLIEKPNSGILAPR